MSRGNGERFTAADYDALPEVLTAEQVGLILSASTPQVRRWAADGVLPGRQFGNRWRFSKSQIEQIIREGTSPDQVNKEADDAGDSTAD